MSGVVAVPIFVGVLEGGFAALLAARGSGAPSRIVEAEASVALGHPCLLSPELRRGRAVEEFEAYPDFLSKGDEVVAGIGGLAEGGLPAEDWGFLRPGAPLSLDWDQCVSGEGSWRCRCSI